MYFTLADSLLDELDEEVGDVSCTAVCTALGDPTLPVADNEAISKEDDVCDVDDEAADSELDELDVGDARFERPIVRLDPSPELDEEASPSEAVDAKGCRGGGYMNLLDGGLNDGKLDWRLATLAAAAATAAAAAAGVWGKGGVRDDEGEVDAGVVVYIINARSSCSPIIKMSQKRMKSRDGGCS
ncbi:hypothetical protein HK102_005362 [Quaeritorhiza haematococci]|nr:hypothetical protein HK102_005362 [Quaeritorhiza haematococci]